MVQEKFYRKGNILLHYYEIENELQPLLLLHAQGVDARSFDHVWGKLSEKYHLYSLDCYGHGKSLHDPEQYHIADIGRATICFIEDVIGEKAVLLGHSSGGLIAAYIAANTALCRRLILEDPPFFSSQGERRKRTYNYLDLSSVCHSFIHQSECKDFVLYYFSHQYAWNFFPEKSREKVKSKMIAMAEKYRVKHPDRDLKVPFWPKAALSGFHGMNDYDPLFGENFYNDSFHCKIAHEEMLKSIQCETIFMKAQTNISEDGILMAALSEDDLKRVASLVPDCRVVRFSCGHGIHIEKAKEFIECCGKYL